MLLSGGGFSFVSVFVCLWPDRHVVCTCYFWLQLEMLCISHEQCLHACTLPTEEMCLCINILQVSIVRWITWLHWWVGETFPDRDIDCTFNCILKRSSTVLDESHKPKPFIDMNTHLKKQFLSINGNTNKPYCAKITVRIRFALNSV